MRIVVLNGPNLDRLGSREPEVYGTTTLSALEAQIADWARKLGIETVFAQSNHEGDLIEAIHDAATSDGIVINPGALTHTSRAIGDAILSVGVPTVEVHISNVKERDPWRAVSTLSDVCVRTIYGRGFPGYRDALRHLANRAALPMLTLRYGPHPDNVADLRMPDTVPSGLAVLIHGGFWLQHYERDSMETMAVDLAGRGIATLNVEYRRLGSGGGWPGSPQDVQTALRWKGSHPDLRGLATSIIGHSAGGHLALWAAAHGSPHPPSLVVGLAPVTDLEALSLSAGSGALPARRLLERGAPAQVPAFPGATLLVHGRDDDQVPRSHTDRLGDDAQVQLVEGIGHFDVLDPSREHWSLVTSALEKAFT
jgi:3-dehydroquinate dehydratase-2